MDHVGWQLSRPKKSQGRGGVSSCARARTPRLVSAIIFRYFVANKITTSSSVAALKLPLPVRAKHRLGTISVCFRVGGMDVANVAYVRQRSNEWPITLPRVEFIGNWPGRSTMLILALVCCITMQFRSRTFPRRPARSGRPSSGHIATISKARGGKRLQSHARWRARNHPPCYPRPWRSHECLRVTALFVLDVHAAIAALSVARGWKKKGTAALLLYGGRGCKI